MKLSKKNNSLFGWLRFKQSHQKQKKSLRNHPNYLLILVAFISIFSVFACVEEYDESNFKLNTNVVSIDGSLSDDKEDQSRVVISESINMNNQFSSSVAVVTDAKVEVLIDGQQRIVFQHDKTTLGTYLSPKDFAAEQAKKYKLLVTMPDGRVFESSEQQMPKAKTKIDSIFYQAEFKESNTFFDANYKFFVDITDPAGLGDNYAWSWKLYEDAFVCLTCGDSQKYNPSASGSDKCVTIPNLYTRYDYECASKCYRILRSTDVNIFKDEFSDGRKVKNIFFANIPFYQYNGGALLEVSQKKLSNEAFRYAKAIEDQNEKSGSLADTPPAAFNGNIKAKNGGVVTGFFSVVTEEKYQFWIDRNEILNKEINGKSVREIGFLGGRLPNFEPYVFGSPPPKAPCEEGYYFTNKKPKGWKN